MEIVYDHKTRNYVTTVQDRRTYVVTVGGGGWGGGVVVVCVFTVARVGGVVGGSCVCVCVYDSKSRWAVSYTHLTLPTRR